MNFKVCGFVVLMLLSCSAWSAKLVIPETFKFLAVDGEDVDGGFFDGPYKIDLKPGIQKIALQYDNKVPDDANPRLDEFIKSEPMLLTLNVIQDGTYKLVPHPDIDRDPRGYAENPRLKVVNPQGQKARYEIALLIEKKESVWSKVTQKDGQKAEPKSEFAELTSARAPAVASTPTSGESPAVAPANGAAPAGDMLQYWWSQADEKTRQEFMRWVYSK